MSYKTPKIKNLNKNLKVFDSYVNYNAHSNQWCVENRSHSAIFNYRTVLDYVSLILLVLNVCYNQL